jgi:nucleoside transporter
VQTTLYFRLALFQFLQFFIWGSWAVTTGTYLLQTQHFSGREVGLVYGTTAIAAMVSPFWAGRLADRHFSLERILAVLHFVGGLLMFTLSTLDRFEVFYPIILLYAICYMPTFALSTALTFHNIPEPARDYPRLRVWGTLGWIATGLCVGGLDLETTALPLRLSAAASIFQSFYVLTLPSTPPPGKQEKTSLLHTGGALLRDRSFMVLLLALSLICVPNAFYYSFVNAYLKDEGFQNAAAMMSIGQATEIVFVLILPYGRRWFGIKPVMLLGISAWGLRYLLLSWGGIELPLLVWLGLAMHGLAWAFTALAGQIYIDEKVPLSLRSTAQGFMALIISGLGAFIGSLIAGEVVSSQTAGTEIHWEKVWLVPGGVGIFTALFFALLFRSPRGEKI